MSTTPTLIVRLRHYSSTQSTFAELGPTCRCVGNVNTLHARDGWQWSSVAAEGVVKTPGKEGRELAQARMVQALREEGFTVDPLAPPSERQCVCPTCDGRRDGCADCLGLGYGWIADDVRRVAS